MTETTWRWRIFYVVDRICAGTGHHFCHRLAPIWSWAENGKKTEEHSGR